MTYQEQWDAFAEMLRTRNYRQPLDREKRPARPKTPARQPCIHLGSLHLIDGKPHAPDGSCISCGGKVVHLCDIHGQCTRAAKSDGVACCRGCDDYEPPDRVPISDNPAEMVESHSEGTNADDEPISAGGLL